MNILMNDQIRNAPYECHGMPDIKLRASPGYCYTHQLATWRDLVAPRDDR